MKKIIGYLKELVGHYFAKESRGNLREIHPGDPVYEGEIVVDESGLIVPDALRMVKTTEVDTEKAEEDVSAYLKADVSLSDSTSHPDIEKKDQQSNEHISTIPKPTVSVDTIESVYAEVDVVAQLSNDEFFIENSGLIRTPEEGEVNINAPIHTYILPELESPEWDDGHVNEQSVEEISEESIVSDFFSPPELTVDAPDLTNDNTPTITGTSSEPNTEVTLTITDAHGETQTLTVTTDEEGNYSVEVPNALHGEYSVTASITDAAGNTAEASDEGNTVDTTASIVLDEISDDYINAIEHEQDLVISGNTTDVEPGQEVTVTFNDKTYTTEVNNDSSFSVTVPASDVAELLDATTHVAYASVSDLAGNVAEDDEDVTVDTSASLTLNEISDDWINAEEHSEELIISGVTSGVEVGQEVTITFNEKEYTAIVNDDGTFSVTIPASDVEALSNGITYEAYASVSDLAGNIATDNEDVTVDLINEATVIATDGNEEDSDNVINSEEVESVIISGSVEPGSIIDKLTITDGINTITVDADDITLNDDGTYYVENLNVSNLEDGLLTVELTTTDEGQHRYRDRHHRERHQLR